MLLLAHDLLKLRNCSAARMARMSSLRRRAKLQRPRRRFKRAVAGPNLMKIWLKFLMKIRNLNNQTDYFRCRQSSGLIIFASERGALRAPEFQRDARDERSSLSRRSVYVSRVWAARSKPLCIVLSRVHDPREKVRQKSHTHAICGSDYFSIFR